MSILDFLTCTCMLRLHHVSVRVRNTEGVNILTQRYKIHVILNPYIILVSLVEEMSVTLKCRVYRMIVGC